MVDIAELAIRVRHEEVDRARTSLERLAQTSERTERAVGEGGKAARKAADGADRHAKATERQARSVTGALGPRSRPRACGAAP